MLWDLSETELEGLEIYKAQEVQITQKVVLTRIASRALFPLGQEPEAAVVIPQLRRRLTILYLLLLVAILALAR